MPPSSPPVSAVPVSQTNSLAGALGSQSNERRGSRSQASSSTPQQPGAGAAAGVETSGQATKRIMMDVLTIMKVSYLPYIKMTRPES